MKYEEIIRFIIELRKEQGWSQEEFANQLHRDKSTINRWEKGLRRPDLDALEQISELFGISINEILAGKRQTNENKEEVEKSFYKYTKSILQKTNRTKLFLILILLVSYISFSVFSVFYFFHNYRSMKVYIVSTESNQYKISKGLFVVTKENIYFQFGNIEPKPEEVSIYKNDDVIYHGDASNIIIDFYGYKSLINYYNLDEFLDNAYLEINDEKMKLSFKETYENNGFFYAGKDDVLKNDIYSKEKIPSKIKEKFDCDELFCTYEDQGVYYTFDINNHSFTVETDSERWNFNYLENNLYYTKIQSGTVETKFYYQENHAVCEVGNCEDADSLYDHFIKEYYNPYFLDE